MTKKVASGTLIAEEHLIPVVDVSGVRLRCHPSIIVVFLFSWLNFFTIVIILELVKPISIMIS